MLDGDADVFDAVLLDDAEDFYDTAMNHQFVGSNLYGFDPGIMRKLADTIGPLPADVAVPPASLPTDYLGMGLR